MKLRSAIIVILVGWLGLACASHGSVSYRFDESVSYADRDIIVQAAKPWNDATLDDTKLIYSASGEYVISTPEHVWVKGVEYDGRECTERGADCPRARTILIKKGLEPTRKSLVATHEFGHALQIKHTTDDPEHDDRPAIMHPWVTADHLTEPDRVECRRAGACGMITGRPLDAGSPP